MFNKILKQRNCDRISTVKIFGTGGIFLEQNNYPSVFIHGFNGYGEPDLLNKKLPYWGLGKMDLLEHLRGLGYEIYNPSVGPHNSAWDRCCELYAEIFGGTVDYGKVHSSKYGHARYGRTYEGLIPDLGSEGNHRKINLLGHSFGGPTVRLFSELLTNGSEEERRGTPEDELSPLFKGGKGDLVHTVTTLSGVNNGTTYGDYIGKRGAVRADLFLGIINILLSETGYMREKDYRTDQWGLMRDPWENTLKNRLTWPFTFKRLRKLIIKTKSGDSMFHELSVSYWYERNRDFSLNGNTYYFAERSCRSHWNRKGTCSPDRNMGPLMKGPSRVTGRYLPEKLAHYGVDKSWLPNDGVMNVMGQSAPFSLPNTVYEEGEPIKPGIFYNMPVRNFDHMSWASVAVQRDEYFETYEKIMERNSLLPG